MNKFERNGNDITVHIATGIPSDEGRFWIYTRVLNFSSEIEARLVLEQLIKHQSKTIESALEAMYEQGYKDGKQKQAKKKWFPTNLTFRF